MVSRREPGLPAPLLMVTNVVAPEDPGQNEVFEFATDGQRRTFGRDPSCDIVIWSAINTRKLTRIAGEIWRSGDELWVRNLSTAHELYVVERDRPGEDPLRRRSDERSRGYACSIPAPLATVTGPDGCRLDVVQLDQSCVEALRPLEEEPTLSEVPDVPDRFRPLAAALCEPLLSGAALPAAYREVMQRIGQPSLKIVRKDVAQLCSVYTLANPRLGQRIQERRVRERLPAAGTSPDRRPTGLALPDYYEVALLLVRYRRITLEDVLRLPVPERV